MQRAPFFCCSDRQPRGNASTNSFTSASISTNASTCCNDATPSETGLSAERDLSKNKASSPSFVGMHPNPGKVDVGYAITPPSLMYAICSSEIIVMTSRTRPFRHVLLSNLFSEVLIRSFDEKFSTRIQGKICLTSKGPNHT